MKNLPLFSPSIFNQQNIHNSTNVTLPNTTGHQRILQICSFKGEVLCSTLCNPMDCSLPVSSVYGIFQARILEWVAISFSRGSSQPRDQTWVSHIAGRCFTVWATREAHLKVGGLKNRKEARWREYKRRRLQSCSLTTVVEHKVSENLVTAKKTTYRLQPLGHTRSHGHSSKAYEIYNTYMTPAPPPSPL